MVLEEAQKSLVQVRSRHIKEVTIDHSLHSFPEGLKSHNQFVYNFRSFNLGAESSCLHLQLYNHQTTPMALKCLPFESDADFNAMAPAIWEAFETPFTPYLRITVYLKGDSPEDRTESIEASAAGALAIHEANPNSHWIKVIDSDTNQLVGASKWVFHQLSPYTGPQELPVATWWPEGEGRTYASNYVQQVEALKSRLYNRPHVCKFSHSI